MTSARMLLRSATAGAHERVDAAFGTADLSSAEGYARFLSAQARAHLPVERALDAAGAGRIVPDWPVRQRAEHLRADLAELGEAVPPPLDAPTFSSGAGILGGIYVLEGSRLGGAMLQRSVSAGLPTRFMGANPSAAWRGLIALLDQQLLNEQNMDEAIHAALAVFERFERAGAYLLKAR